MGGRRRGPIARLAPQPVSNIRIRGGISARPAGCTDETLHQFALLKKRARMTANVQVFGRRDCETIGALLRPATEKRQGTSWVPAGQQAL
jgi:hypothetical protein